MRVDAFAKLTLSLHVTGVRADGYHEIDAVMVSVTEPHDVVTIEPADRTSLVVNGPFADGVPADASNLAWRAADACGATVAIHIEKGIPHGAGLGGGSADAAAVLVALGADASIGATIGADVPFCMTGGAAVVRGIGDELHAVEFTSHTFVIATPPFRCATADVYRAWDSLGGPEGGFNDLEPAAHRVEPRLVAFRDALQDAAGATAVLAGSGSSYALIFESSSAAEAARARIIERVDAHVWLGTTAPAGVAMNP
jgi:4-diphosphocytidyl-2-C-methyl-D-erythritol kinase